MTNNERDDLAAWFHMEFEQGSGCIHLTNYRSQCETWADQFLLTGKGLLPGADELIAERDRLRRWKAEALEVMEVMEGLHDLGRALGIPLGEKVTGPLAISYAEGLRAKAQSEQRAAQHYREQRDEAQTALAALLAGIEELAAANDVRMGRSGASAYTGIGSDALRALIPTMTTEETQP